MITGLSLLYLKHYDRTCGPAWTQNWVFFTSEVYGFSVCYLYFWMKVRLPVFARNFNNSWPGGWRNPF